MIETCWIGRLNVLGQVIVENGLAVIQAFGNFTSQTTNGDPGIDYGRFLIPQGTLQNGWQILFDVAASDSPGNLGSATPINIRFVG